VARGSALSFATRSTDPVRQANKKSAELRLQERVSLPVRQNGQNHQNAKLRRLILGGIKTDYFSAQRLIGQMVKIISTTRTTATANGAQWSRMLLQNS